MTIYKWLVFSSFFHFGGHTTVKLFIDQKCPVNEYFGIEFHFIDTHTDTDLHGKCVHVTVFGFHIKHFSFFFWIYIFILWIILSWVEYDFYGYEIFSIGLSDHYHSRAGCVFILMLNCNHSVSFNFIVAYVDSCFFCFAVASSSSFGIRISHQHVGELRS